MNQQTAPASAANVQSSAQDIFLLTDEQILEIEPEPQHDVPVTSSEPEAQRVAARGVPPPAAEAEPTQTNTESAVTTTAGAFTTAEDVRALSELYPGGLNQAKTAAERARTLDEIDAAYFGAANNSPEQASAARAQLAQRLLNENPDAFREMVFAGLRALEAANVASRSSAASVSAPRQSSGVGPASPALATPVAQLIPAVRDATEAQAGLPAPQGHLAAYSAFEKAANEELERSVGGAIDHALHQALPNLGSGDERTSAGARHGVPLHARLSAAIRGDVEKALQGDRQLGGQIAQILSSRRFDNETRAQVVRLINDRAQQLVPGAAKRALNDWTQATLAAHGAKSERSASASSRREVAAVASVATTPGPPVHRHRQDPGAARPRTVDYHKLSDEQILDL